jgi:hypothetical protein
MKKKRARQSTRAQMDNDVRDLSLRFMTKVLREKKLENMRRLKGSEFAAITLGRGNNCDIGMQRSNSGV